MWRRVYLVLLVLRLYFALSPSYLHPDENFQGPEVIAGQVFSYPVHYTWEFTSEHPIRSVFPLWLVYGIPMLILRSLWQGLRNDHIPPALVYWTLRVLMFTLSFVLEDWALLELINSTKHRRVAMILTASSFVTWTYQTHTFSNAIETLVVLWSLVLIARIIQDKERSGIFTCAVLSFLIVLGGFNRITFPAYLLVPGLQLFPHFRRQPLSLLSLLFFTSIFSFMAIIFDTTFYSPHITTYFDILRSPVITPLNNLLYNFQSSNLAAHGLHPFYQHALINLPQLLGPAYLLVFLYPRRSFRLYSAISAVSVLSLFPHQEARFLIPAIPLILSSIRLPPRLTRTWIALWTLFNLFMGALMGTFHQGGVVPMQIYVAGTNDINHVYWWKTYSPPIWLLDGKIGDVETTDFMGADVDSVIKDIGKDIKCNKKDQGVVLVAPASVRGLESYIDRREKGLVLKERQRYSGHISLDDLDFVTDGVWGTLKRVVVQRGLVLWNVERIC